MHKQTLNEEETRQLVALMQKLEPGFLPLDVFLQFARVYTTPILEVVPLRLGPDGRAEVLLMKRPEDDPHWPSMLHTPGTVIRATDSHGNGYKDAFARVLSGELEGVGLTGDPVYVENLLHDSGRGAESAIVFFVEVIGDPVVGVFYPLDSLPPTLVQPQLDFIMPAAKKFLELKHDIVSKKVG